MMGDVTEGSTQRLHGIIPQCMELLFTSIAAEVDLFNRQAREAAAEAGEGTAQSLSYAVAVSFFEIYNEKVYDLLGPPTHRHSLDVRENAESGVHIPDLTRRIISSPSQAVDYITTGNDNRRVAATAHNVVSSRSHAVIQVTVERKVVGGGGGLVVSRLDLVDLAGSERYDSRTHGAETKDGRSKAAEMSSINKSLNNLALVVTALTSQSKHIPYRNSTLTHLLKDSLGGNAKCQLIACINPSVEGAYESMNTLKYASRAKLIKNEARPAAQRGEGEEGMRGLHAEIERLKREGVAEKKKRRFFISSMTGVVTRMAQVCEEDDLNEVPIEEEDLLTPEAEGEADVDVGGEEKVIPPLPMHVDTRRSSSERLSVRFQDELDASLLPLNTTVEGGLNSSLLNASSILNQSTRSYSGRRYQFCDLFSTPHRKQKRRYRFSVCDSLQPAPSQVDPTPQVSPVLFSPATERLLQDFDAGMGKIYAVVKRKGRRDELRRESAMEVVREVEEMERVIQQVKEEGDRRERERDALVSQHHQQMQEREVALTNAQDRLAVLQREGRGKEEEMMALKAEVTAKGEEMVRLGATHEREMAARDCTIREREAAIAGLQRSLASKEEERQRLLMRIAVLEDALREKEEECQVLHLRVDRLTQEARQKEQETLSLIAQFDTERAATQFDIQQQAELIRTAQSQVDEVMADASSLRLQLRHAEEEAEVKSREADERSRKMAALQVVVQRYSQQVELMTAAAASDAQRYEELIGAARLKATVATDEMREENEMVLAAMMAESDEAKASWEKATQQQAAVLAQTTQQMEALSQQLRGERDAAQQHHREMEDSRAALIAKQKELISAQSDLCAATLQRQVELQQHEAERQRLLEEAGRRPRGDQPT